MEETERRESFGRYRVLEEIGRGGMGVVYRAWDPDLGRNVALKRMRTEALRYPDQVERFLRDARAAARLRHPGIVAIHDVGSVEGRPYFTMDLVEGRTLAIGDPVSILRQVAEAVGAAHRAGIVRRDLRPANILVGADARAYVTAFGLVKELSEEETKKLTVSGQLLGRPPTCPRSRRGAARSLPRRISGRSASSGTNTIIPKRAPAVRGRSATRRSGSNRGTPRQGSRAGICASRRAIVRDRRRISPRRSNSCRSRGPGGASWRKKKRAAQE